MTPFSLPSPVQQIIQKLSTCGYEAYVVGGAVRDLLLGAVPKDYDIATNAPPDTVEGIFDKTIPTGKAYGTITVVYEGESFEVTTYRKDLDYDGRRPRCISFSETLEEDLSRRDFTINAMAMGIDGEVIDFFGGKIDLIRNEVNFVGDPFARITEDKLRMLRWIRFMCRLGFSSKHQDLGRVDLSNLSYERIRDELSAILLTPTPSKGMMYLQKHQLLEQILPELMPSIDFDQHTPYHDLDVFSHTLKVLDHTTPDLALRLAALLHDAGKPTTFTLDTGGTGHFYGHHKASMSIAKTVLTRLRFSSQIVQTVSDLIEHHMLKVGELSPSTLKKLIHQMGPETLTHFQNLLYADRLATKAPHDLSDIDAFCEKCKAIQEEKLPISIKDLKVNGHDLMALGYQGPEIGRTLQVLLEKVLEDSSLNNREMLLESLKKDIEKPQLH